MLDNESYEQNDPRVCISSTQIQKKLQHESGKCNQIINNIDNALGRKNSEESNKNKDKYRFSCRLIFELLMLLYVFWTTYRTHSKAMPVQSSLQTPWQYNSISPTSSPSISREKMDIPSESVSKQDVAKLENKIEKLEDELLESRRRESNADIMQSSNFDQLKEMLEKSVEKMANNSDIVDLNQRLEEVLKNNRELKGELGKLRGEMMVKNQQMENMKEHQQEMAVERLVQKSGDGEENERAIVILQQSIKSLDQQLESTGRLEEMEQKKSALEKSSNQLPHSNLPPASNRSTNTSTKFSYVHIPNANAWSGVKHGAMMDVDEPFFSESKDKCIESCRMNRMCSFVVFRKDTKRCWMRWGFVRETAQRNRRKTDIYLLLKELKLNVNDFDKFMKRNFEDPCNNEVKLYSFWEDCGFGCGITTIIYSMLDLFWRNRTFVVPTKHLDYIRYVKPVFNDFLPMCSETKLRHTEKALPINPHVFYEMHIHTKDRMNLIRPLSNHIVVNIFWENLQDKYKEEIAKKKNLTSLEYSTLHVRRGRRKCANEMGGVCPHFNFYYNYVKGNIETEDEHIFLMTEVFTELSAEINDCCPELETKLHTLSYKDVTELDGTFVEMIIELGIAKESKSIVCAGSSNICRLLWGLVKVKVPVYNIDTNAVLCGDRRNEDCNL